MALQKLEADTGKHEVILAAALSLFAERGFHGTAMPLVAERARVGAGTVYRYFESKEHLVNAVFQDCKRKMADALLIDFPMDAPPRKAFHELWRRLGKFAEESPEALAFLELHHHAPYLDATSRALDEQLLEPFRLFVMHAQREGALKSGEPNLLIAIVFGAFHGVMKGCQASKLTWSKPLVEQAEKIVWEAIRA
jgi:AcrR family transcriptional regulator